ncbi:MAG: response regulator, partial [Thermodesulfobacteriota bacterium]|nr:response regulator [Thermodesulfobacteriota bacterium]
MNEIEKIDVLLVDDRPENLVALEALLEDLDLNIVKATSGNDALGLVLEYDLALILLDVQMPDMDGFETAELMRGSEKTRHIPIIFVTAISKDMKYVFKGYESGAVDYLFKPLNPDILRSKVKIFLELHRQKKALEKSTLDLKQIVEELKKANHKILVTFKSVYMVTIQPMRS